MLNENFSHNSMLSAEVQIFMMESDL